MEVPLGVAPIKPEFIRPRPAKEERVEQRPVDDDAAEDAGKEDQTQPGSKKRKQRGQNKGRYKEKRKVFDHIILCNAIARDEPCPKGEECRYSHGLEAYLRSKAEDIGPECHNFRTFGRQVLSSLLAAKNYEPVKNVVTRELQTQLRTKTYPTPRSDKYLAVMEVETNIRRAENEARQAANLARANREKVETDSTTPTPKPTHDGIDETNEVTVEEMTKIEADREEDLEYEVRQDGDNVDESIPQARIGPITHEPKRTVDFRNKLYLAPLTTVGNLPFRRICKRFGADITCGEMAMTQNLLQGQQTEWALMKRHESEDIFGVQICGNKPQNVVRAAEVINKETDVDFIDLNLGCPIDLVCNTGGGSALMEQSSKLKKMLDGMQTVVDVPITVKFRMGVKDHSLLAHKLAPKFQEWGCALGTLHGRTKQQRYQKDAHWDYIADVKKTVNTMPLFGNGDIYSWQDAERHRQESGVDGLIGALIKPWLFTEIKEKRDWDISASERFDILKEYCKFGLEHWGSDTEGVNKTRRFLCEWQSFLHRYIPIGLLERTPIRINDRPPVYVGRNDLETLMASEYSGDWIKISEMLLGPAPEDFSFIPKHKANAYQG